MPNLVVTFLTLKVHDDADWWPDGAGEIYYEFNIGDTKVLEVTRDDAREVDDRGDDTIQLNQSTNIVVRDDAVLTISGKVSERDTVSDDDNAGSFKHTYSSGDGWGLGSHDVRLNQDDSLDVTVTYSIRQI